MSEAFEFDVVVVGHGIAGLCAAVSAMERGKKVAVLERAPEDDSGGCTRYTEAYLRLKSEDELSDDFEEILAQCGVSSASPNIVQAMAQAPEQWSGVVRSSAVTDPDFIATFARETIPTIQWLKDKGIRFIATHLPHITLRDHTPMIVPSGGGLAMQEALLASAVKGGVSFFYETAARGLMQDAQGKITGVEAVSRNNRPMQFHAGSVVLACGGFEGNPEMLARYMGQAPPISARSRRDAISTWEMASRWRKPPARRSAVTTTPITPPRSTSAPGAPRPRCWCFHTASW
ncbi:FAD-dependent oxidoreductase [Paracandidimonas soli]|uniref:FAD-dependent oxidoreductase n=1 Tax=Paracandidimonas soli TaxID=1917182 RepID=UPI00360F804A